MKHDRARQFGDIWPAMVTPLDERGEPRLDAVEQLVELFVGQQLGGLYVLGSTGGWPLLSIAARMAVAQRTVEVADGRIPIMIHVGAVATDDAVTLARHAAEIGADAVSSVAPIYYPAGPDVVFEHYRRIGAAAELPLFVYHLQSVNTLKISASDYVERLLTLPNIAGMKYTDGNLYQLGLLSGEAAGRLKFFSGADELCCQAAVSGACGAIGTFYNLFGRECQAVRRAFVAGDFDIGLRFMQTFQAVIARVIEAGALFSFLRAGMRLKYDIEIGMPRAPLGVTDRAWEEADVRKHVEQVDTAAAGVVAAAGVELESP